MSVAIPTIGASGAIYGVLLAAAIMFPDRQIWLIPFPVTIPMKIYVAGAIAIEFFMTLGTGGDNVSHVTHLGGALVGYLYLRRGLFLYRVRNDYLDWKRKRATRRKFEVYMRDPQERAAWELRRPLGELSFSSAACVGVSGCSAWTSNAAFHKIKTTA